MQFDPVTRDVNGKKVTDVTVKAIGSQKLVKLTIWPEHGSPEVAKGTFIAADGKFTSNMGQAADGSPREYLNLSVIDLFIGQPVPKAEREVVTTSSNGGSSSSDLPF